jgi:hypothetical protein
VVDKSCPHIVEKLLPHLPMQEKVRIKTDTQLCISPPLYIDILTADFGFFIVKFSQGSQKKRKNCQSFFLKTA